jgi:hypothetical protein
VVLRDAFLGEGEEEQSMYDGGSMLAEGTSPARETEAALVELSSSISSGLTQYRDQFCSWEQLQAHSLPSSSSQLASVVKASSRIDQGFARFVFVMEPFKSLSDRFAALASSLHHLGSYLDQSHRFELDTQLSVCPSSFFFLISVVISHEWNIDMIVSFFLFFFFI